MVFKKNIYSILIFSLLCCKSGITGEVIPLPKEMSPSDYSYPVGTEGKFLYIKKVNFNLSGKKLEEERKSFLKYLRELSQRDKDKRFLPILEIKDEKGLFKEWVQNFLPNNNPELCKIYNDQIYKLIEKKISTLSLKKSQEIVDFWESYLVPIP